ncbi:hypothetical protein OROMI_027308 [Orobanche minor]
MTYMSHASHALFANLPVNLEPFCQFARLGERLALLGFVLKEVKGDGSCVFRALSDQLFRTKKEHLYVRRVAVAQLRVNRHMYIHNWSDKRFNKYVKRMSKSGTWTDLIATMAVLDAIEVKMVEMVPNVASAISEIYPTNGRHYTCAHHGNILIPCVGEVPLDPLRADMIPSMRPSGCFTAEDLGRHKHLKYEQALED